MKKTFRDQLNREIILGTGPARIISLVPSITELICDLGLGSCLVGRTRFCIHPEIIKNDVPVVGGTKNVHFDRISRLSPSIIIANKEENTKEAIELLEKSFTVWVSNVSSLFDSFEMIRRLGELFKKETEARHVIHQSKGVIDGARKLNRCKVIYLIWKDPFMTIGGDTYISDLLDKMGFDNVFKTRRRYPKINVDEIVASKAKIVLLSSEPYPFKESHLPEISRLLGIEHTLLVDGEFFSWYGSRLLKKKEYVKQLESVRSVK